MRSQAPLATLMIGGLVCSGAVADIVYDEASDGDLSDDRFSPTVLEFTGGANTVVFTTDRDGDDKDIFTFVVGEGFELSGVILDLFDTNADDPNNLGFIGFSAGNVLGVDPDSPNPANLLGYALVLEADSGSDIFDVMAAGGGAQGYDGPLGAGSYTFWAQETSPTVDDWQLTLLLTPVPGPGVLGLAAVAGLAANRRRR